MKITRNNLRKLILREVSSFQMKQYDNESNNILMMTSIIMTGMQTQTGQMLDEDEEYEYGQEVRHILETNMPVTKALSDVFMEIRTGGGFKDPEPESVALPPKGDTITTITDPQALERLKGPKSEK